MPEPFHHLVHLVSHAFVRWYTFLGTSPGGVVAQVLVLILTEMPSGGWRLSAWRTTWKGGLKRAVIVLGTVWILAFAACVTTTLYDDHMSLVDQVGRMKVERDHLEAKSTSEQNEIQQLRNAPPPKPVTIQGPCKLTAEQINPARLPQPCPGAPPPTLRDRVLAIDTHLTEGDRNRFSDALTEFSASLGQGESLAYKLNAELGSLGQGERDGTIAKQVQQHEQVLSNITAEGWKYQKAFPPLRTKWDMFREQSEYIFGDNPDNLGPNAIINSSEAYRNYLEWWNTIPNKDQRPALNLLSVEHNEAQGYLDNFFKWQRGCVARLDEMRSSIH
jgi:hypothetical protein